MIATRGREEMRKVVEWAASALDLPSPPSHNAMLHRFRKDATITTWMYSHGLKMKKKWTNFSNVLYELLRKCVCKMWDCGVFLAEAIITGKAQRLQWFLNQSSAESQQTKIKFSTRLDACLYKIQ